MGLNLSTKPTVNFNPDATFTKSHAAATNAGNSVNGAIDQSNRTGKAVEAALQEVGGKLHAERNDGGVHNNSMGSLGFLGKTAAAIGIAAVGGPVGAVAGAALAVAEGAAFIKQAVSNNSENEKSYFVDYSRSGKTSKPNANDEDPIIGSYTDSSGETYNYGFDHAQQNTLAKMGMMPGRGHAPVMLDSREQKILEEQYATLQGKAKDLQEQGATAQSFAHRNNVATENTFDEKGFAGGPKPPAGGPGHVSPKAMSFGM